MFVRAPKKTMVTVLITMITMTTRTMIMMTMSTLMMLTIPVLGFGSWMQQSPR